MSTTLPAPPPTITGSTLNIHERIAQLRAGRPRVAWLYERWDTSTFRYRVRNMVDALTVAPDARPLGAAWFFQQELPELLRLVPELDALVIARYRYRADLHELVVRAERYGVPVLFDCDDLVFDLDAVPLIIHTLAQESGSDRVWSDWYAYVGRLNATARLCHAGVTTTRPLAEMMAKTLDGPVSIIPNHLNREQQAYSRDLLDARRGGGWQRGDEIIIGYFSGTPSHNRDFALVTSALAKLFAEDTRVRLRIVGYLDRVAGLEAFSDRIDIQPVVDYLTLQRLIAEVDINIAPLQENAFTGCKSDLKFFEAAAVGTWTVASPTPVFEAAIDHGVTGQLARAHQWYDQLGEAIALVEDRPAYAARADEAAAVVDARYGWDAYRERLESVIDGCAKRERSRP